MSLEHNLFLAQLAKEAEWSRARTVGDLVWWVNADGCGLGVVAELVHDDEHDETTVRLIAFDYEANAEVEVWADVIDLKQLPNNVVAEELANLEPALSRLAMTL